jgi:hypothetical protein
MGLKFGRREMREGLCVERITESGTPATMCMISGARQMVSICSHSERLIEPDWGVSRCMARASMGWVWLVGKRAKRRMMDKFTRNKWEIEEDIFDREIGIIKIS